MQLWTDIIFEVMMFYELLIVMIALLSNMGEIIIDLLELPHAGIFLPPDVFFLRAMAIDWNGSAHTVSHSRGKTKVPLSLVDKSVFRLSNVLKNTMMSIHQRQNCLLPTL